MIPRCKLETGDYFFAQVAQVALMISVPMNLRCFYFLLSIEEQRQKAARHVPAIQKILEYNLNLVLREVFRRAC